MQPICNWPGFIFQAVPVFLLFGLYSCSKAVLTPTSSSSKTRTCTTCHASGKHSVPLLLLFHSANTPLLVLRLFPGAGTLTRLLVELIPVTLPRCCALRQRWPIAIPKAAIPSHQQVSGWSTDCSWDAACHPIRFAHPAPHKLTLQPWKVKWSQLTAPATRH